MTIRVLIVDDSTFICKSIQRVLEEEADFKIVGFALNGEEAVVLATQLKPDVITMDVEMPIMDGITAVKQIMAKCPTAILMFSAATKVGAKATLDALDAGAIDFLPKQLEQIDGNKELAKRILRQSVRNIARQTKKTRLNFDASSDKTGIRPKLKSSLNSAKTQKQLLSSVRTNNRKIELLVIVASTGGPVAIQKVLTQLSANCPFPVLIVQHMPKDFTRSFAERLNQVCQVKVKEAVDGDNLTAGEVLVGPGGMQMEVNSSIGKKKISIRTKQEGELFSPCADITLASILEHYSANVLTLVLTGMGTDGKEGAIKLKQKGFSIWAQDEASSTIYGMPKAIVDANLANKVLSLDEIAHEFTRLG
jgi:two-component system chemotaxis response regulator CheB